MKTTAVIVLTLIVAASCEVCTIDSDCVSTGCSSHVPNGEVKCIEGTCTCVAECSPEPALWKCSHVNDCRDAYIDGNMDCTCALNDLHCIDQICHSVAFCEDCSNDNDCTATECADNVPNGVVKCIDMKCTCVNECAPEPNLARCRNLQDCRNAYSNGQIACTCAIADLHCIDGACHCKYPSNS